jgi:L-ascorbate metabolism protein UlaG (beta-lactamase superfamily)
MLTTATARLVTDPLLPNFFFGLRRARAAGVADADLAEIDVCLVSHAHRDHLHLPSLARQPRTATLVVPRGCAPLVAGLGFRHVVEMTVGERQTLASCEIIAVPARHAGGRAGLFPGGQARAALGYLVRTEGCTALFVGDTGYFSGFAEIAERFRPDVACLPIGGYEPASLREEHMSPLDAVFAFEDLGAALLVPITHGSFALSYEPLDAPLRWLREIAKERGIADRVAALGHGETVIVRRPAPAG